MYKSIKAERTSTQSERNAGWLEYNKKLSPNWNNWRESGTDVAAEVISVWTLCSWKSYFSRSQPALKIKNEIESNRKHCVLDLAKINIVSWNFICVSHTYIHVYTGSWGLIYLTYWWLGLKRSFKTNGRAILAILRTLDLALRVIRNHWGILSWKRCQICLLKSLSRLLYGE